MLCPSREVSFEIMFNGEYPCNTLNDFNEGVEFAYRLASNADKWVPLKFIYYKSSSKNIDIHIGNKKNLTLRGYSVRTESLNYDIYAVFSSKKETFELCNFNFGDLIQFRWLQTSFFRSSDTITKDNWILNFISVKVYTIDNDVVPLINEHFESDNLK